jgi:hypothetical protein
MGVEVGSGDSKAMVCSAALMDQAHSRDRDIEVILRESKAELGRAGSKECV